MSTHICQSGHFIAPHFIHTIPVYTTCMINIAGMVNHTYFTILRPNQFIYPILLGRNIAGMIPHAYLLILKPYLCAYPVYAILHGPSYPLDNIDTIPVNTPSFGNVAGMVLHTSLIILIPYLCIHPV